jgi:hypothetical protein
VRSSALRGALADSARPRVLNDPHSVTSPALLTSWPRSDKASGILKLININVEISLLAILANVVNLHRFKRQGG